MALTVDELQKYLSMDAEADPGADVLGFILGGLTVRGDDFGWAQTTHTS
jgi:hypothetical protein